MIKQNSKVSWIFQFIIQPLSILIFSVITLILISLNVNFKAEIIMAVLNIVFVILYVLTPIFICANKYLKFQKLFNVYDEVKCDNKNKKLIIKIKCCGKNGDHQIRQENSENCFDVTINIFVYFWRGVEISFFTENSYSHSKNVNYKIEGDLIIFDINYTNTPFTFENNLCPHKGVAQLSLNLYDKNWIKYNYFNNVFERFSRGEISKI